MRSAIALGLVVLAFSTACAEYVGRSTTPAGIVRGIAVSAASADALSAAGEMRVVTAHLIDVFGSEIPSPEVSWRTSDSTVATVAGSGSRAIVTAVGDGTATVSATSEGVVGAIAITVQRRSALAELPAASEPAAAVEPSASPDAPRVGPVPARGRLLTRRAAPKPTA